MYLRCAVYILKCRNGTFYTGYTTSISRRIKEHKKGEVSYTKDKLPIELIHISFFSDKQLAYDYERYLKSGSGKAFMKWHLI